MCIYFGDAPGLTYKKREHIFPGGVGWDRDAAAGVVSDQATTSSPRWRTS